MSSIFQLFRDIKISTACNSRFNNLMHIKFETQGQYSNTNCLFFGGFVRDIYLNGQKGNKKQGINMMVNKKKLNILRF